MPSVTEPFGITPLEAMKNGTPVLISKQSGVSEVIKNCLKVDFWDIDAIASKILSILYNDTLSESLSQNGYHDVAQLTWSSQADKVLEVYQSLL
jgi:glycosyltransferase involved in cell wall biosynthesis